MINTVFLFYINMDTQVDIERYEQILEELKPYDAQLIAVSKTKPVSSVLRLYAHGQRDFGENYVQEFVDKAAQCTHDIKWHFIGHLQTNKVKQIVSLTHLIHGIDSIKLLREVNKQSAKLNTVTPVLLQVHIAEEETKFGFTDDDIVSLFESEIISGLEHVHVRGLMGMATLTSDRQQIKKEFKGLFHLYEYCRKQLVRDKFDVLSMGMTADYSIALDCGSNMIRIGSALFGERVKAEEKDE